MKRIVVAGIDTDVGKTVVSAVICKALQADYWKPVQCGCLEQSDGRTVGSLVDDPSLVQHPPAYALRLAASPHYAAALEHLEIDPGRIAVPPHRRPLVIECAGGLCVPYADNVLQVDLFSAWDCAWILVSQHYLGSINHSLLALEALKARQQHLAGIVFNGTPHEPSERVILRHVQAPMLGRLLPEASITAPVVNRYAQVWRSSLIC